MVAIDRVRNIGIIAHIDAGKTTVTERFLFYTGKEHKIGEVHQGTAKMDWREEEQERGITISAAATAISWRDHRINLLDTPGHVDFTAEVERSLRVLDGAVVVFDAVHGVEAQSETVWRQADGYHLPRICFVNKLDRRGASFERCVESIRSRFAQTPLVLQLPIGTESELRGVIDLIELRAVVWDGSVQGAKFEIGEVPANQRDAAAAARLDLVATLADLDDGVAEAYLAERPVSGGELRAAVVRATRAARGTPVLCGAALRNRGIQPLLDAVVDYLPSPADVPPMTGRHPETGATEIRPCSDSAPLSALVFKTFASRHGDLIYLRVYSGTLAENSHVFNPRVGRGEKIQQLYRMHANHRERIDRVVAGDIVATVGLKFAATGDTLCAKSDPVMFEPAHFPKTVMATAIEPKSTADRDRLAEVLVRLEKEDPTFEYREDPETGQMVIYGMGELHLEVLKNRMLRDFAVDANVGSPRVSYRQTVAGPGSGTGLFDQESQSRRQFGEVTLAVVPLEDPEGFELSWESAGMPIPPRYRPAVEEAIRSEARSGAGVGYPLIGVRVTVTGGQFSEEDSTELAFEVAAARAMHEAVEAAGRVMLEPVMRVEIRTPTDFVGGVLGDLDGRGATILGAEPEGDGSSRIEATVPMAQMFGYVGVLRSLTQGRASHSMERTGFQAVEGVRGEL